MSKRRKQPQILIRIPKVAVGIRVAPNDYEGGGESWTHGDEVISVDVNCVGPARRPVSRYEVADKLRELADVVAHTRGNPIEEATIVVLFRKPRKANGAKEKG